jgi:hypothetical protein
VPIGIGFVRKHTVWSAKQSNMYRAVLPQSADSRLREENPSFTYGLIILDSLKPVRRDIFPRIALSAVSWLLEFDLAVGWRGSAAQILPARGGIAPQVFRCRMGTVHHLAFRAARTGLKAAA